MKAALLLAAVFSVILSVLATPTTSRSGVTSLEAPAGFQPPDVDSSAKPETAAVDVVDVENKAAATQYWVCIAVSQSTLGYGWSRGGSKAAALGGAKSHCGRRDCSFYSCAELGCVGIDYGSRSVALSYATGFGSADGSKAASKALSSCESRDRGCRKPGDFCSARIV